MLINASPTDKLSEAKAHASLWFRLVARKMACVGRRELVEMAQLTLDLLVGLGIWGASHANRQTSYHRLDATKSVSTAKCTTRTLRLLQ